MSKAPPVKRIKTEPSVSTLDDEQELPSLIPIQRDEAKEDSNCLINSELIYLKMEPQNFLEENNETSFVQICDNGNFESITNNTIPKTELADPLDVNNQKDKKGITVEIIKKLDFSNLSLIDKIKIKNMGRPTPHLIIAQKGVSKNGAYTRSFRNDRYEKVQWLCGSEVTNTLYCYPCLLFGYDKTWTETGFTNINRLKEKIEKHEESRQHVDSVVSLATLERVDVFEEFRETESLNKINHNEEVKKNREILSQIINCIKLYCKHELTLSNLSDNPNFIMLNPDLQNCIEKSPVFNRTSKTIQNDLLQCMLEVCRAKIISEIEQTSYVTVMVEDTSDVSENTEFTIIFRYELKGIVYERFWIFFNPKNDSADCVFSCIVQEIDKVLPENDQNKLIALTFNSASFFQQYIQQKFPNLYFVHSYTHEPFLILKHICAPIKSTRLFFANYLGIETFFAKSPQILAALEGFVSSRSQNSVNKLESINLKTVFENKDNLIHFFEGLQSLKMPDEIIQASTCFLGLLKSESFSSWLEIFSKILPNLEKLYKEIQSSNMDSNKIKNALKEFKKTIYNSQNKLCMVSKEICDRIWVDTEQRFSFTSHLRGAELFYNQKDSLGMNDIEEICEKFPVLVEQKLNTELKVFYFRKELHSFKGITMLLKLFSEDDFLKNTFSETIKLIKILVTLPMTTSEPERCFTIVKRVKAFPSSMICLDKLTAITMISIEQNMVSDIEHFNEKVIEKFCKMKNQKIDFLFK